MKKSLLCVLTLLLVAGCKTTTSSPSESSEVTSSAVVESSSTVVESSTTSSSVSSSSSSSVSSATESSSVVIHPTSVTVTSLVSGTLLVGETRLLSATTVPEVVSNPAVSWASSNTSLATVTEGLVTAVSAGVVTITATVDGVNGTLEIEVVAPLINVTPGLTHPYADNFNYSALGEGKISVDSNKPLSEAAFDYQGKLFYAEATFKTLESFWVWDQVSLYPKPITALDGVSQRSWGLAFSGSIKAIEEDLKGTDIQWGLITDRSQVWGQGLSGISADNYKLSTILKDGTVYYFVNDGLQYVSSGWAGLADVEAIPTISVQDARVEVTGFDLKTDVTFIDNYLAGSEGKLLVADPANTIVSADSKTVTFNNISDIINLKDRRAFSAGDALVFPANESARIEFDYKVDSYGNDADSYVFAFNMRFRDGNGTDCRSVYFKNSAIGNNSWNWNDSPSQAIQGTEFPLEELEVGQTVHVVITRVISDRTHILVKVGNSAPFETVNSSNVGTFYLSFSCSGGNATVSNISAVSQVPLINTTPSATHPYANKFNYSALGEGKLSVNADEALAEAAFDYQGKFFYAEATFKTLESFWVWDQVSIHAKPLTALSGISQRSWGVAFGDGSKKAIGEELVGSAIQWGQFTDRTQVWGQGGIQNLDATNYKLTTVLKEGKVYYFVDDILQYVDASWAGLGGVDAIPTISVQRAKVEVTNITLSTSMTVINDYLAGNEGKLLAALAGSTTVSADSKTINFIGNTNGWPFDNVKDRRAYSAGEALVFPANAPSASIEFDYKIDAYGNDEDAYRFAFTMQRTEGLVKECRSVLLSNYETGMEAWGWDGGSGLGFNWGHTSVGDLEVGKTYHIVITRVLTSEGANGDGLMNNYAISIDGVPYTLTGHDNYSGTYTLSFAVLKGNATISNISAVA